MINIEQGGKEGETREFRSEAWVGEPDNRTQHEFAKARFKVAFWGMLIMVGAMAFCVAAVFIFRFAQWLLQG